MVRNPVSERLRQALGERPTRDICEATGHGAETVRRYLTTTAPSAEFLGRVCQAFGLSVDWALTGKGSPRLADAEEAALLEAQGPELLRALVESIERIAARVESIERSIESLERRVSEAQRLCDAAPTPVVRRRSASRANGAASGGRGRPRA